MRSGQAPDRIVGPALRGTQFLCTFLAMMLFGTAFKGDTIVIHSDGKPVKITVYYGGPAVNFALVVAFAAAMYCLFSLAVKLSNASAIVPLRFTFWIDALFTVFLLSSGCSVAASDYMRYCDTLSERVHCRNLRSGAVLCLLAFVVFLASVGWSVWLKIGRGKPTSRASPPSGPPMIDECVAMDAMMERSTSSIESPPSTYLQTNFTEQPHGHGGRMGV